MISNNNPKILVLLSSYNGEKYIGEQINSILNQKKINVKLLIRDDGSKDRTWEILTGIKDERVTLIKGENVGVISSFYELISSAGDYEYYSLSDQDDIWDDDKLSVAVEAIEQYCDIPALYSSNTRLVDNNMNVIFVEDQDPITSLGSAIVKNYVTGCTTVFNNPLKKLAVKNLPSEVKAHEWWLNLVALSNGGVSIYDVTPHMNYRQHGGNVVGAPTSKLKKWSSRLKKFLKSDYRRDYMAHSLLDTYGANMSMETTSILKSVANVRKNKFKVIRDRRIRTKNSIDNICFFILVLFGKV